VTKSVFSRHSCSISWFHGGVIIQIKVNGNVQ